MNHLVIFSALYLIVASMSPVMGAYVLRLNHKAAINRVFFLISICLTLWAFGFSVIIVAPNEQTAVVWTRISAIGYEILYSALVHFSLLLTGHTRILKKTWFYAILYLPAAICLYAFVVAPEAAGVFYHFVQTESGWKRSMPFSFYDAFFQAYFLGSVAASLTLIALWKHKLQVPQIKKTANIILWAFALALVLGAFTDIVNGNYIELPLPQMAPMFFGIPLSALFYCINKLHLMKSNKERETDLILNDERRIMIFRIASLGLIFGGIVLFLLEHFWWNSGDFALTLLASLLLVALGGLLLYVQRTRKGFSNLEKFLIFVTLTVTPILTVNMVENGGTALWAFPVMLIVSALVFGSRDTLFSSSITILFSQVYLWTVVPEVSVLVNYRAYSSRIIILLCIIVVAYFVHTVYTQRLRDNVAQARTQSLVSGIVASFSLSDREDAPQHMTALLTELAEFFDAEKALIGAVENEFGDLIGMHQYTADGSELSPEYKMLCMERWEAYRKETLLSADDAANYGQRFGAEQIQALRATPWLFVPIFEKNRPVAFIYLETSRTGNAWSKEQVVALPIVSRIVSDALEKLSSEIRIKFMAYYDSLTRLPNRQLFNDRAEQAIHLARRNNRVIGFMFLDLDFFKSINDTMGHDSGDLLLQMLGQRLSDCLRKSDTVARFGGDEFLVLLNSIADVEDLGKVADKIMSVFQEPIELCGQEVFITASAGVSVFPVDGEDAQTLIKHADIAMYTAKEKGKNQYAFCSHNMKELVQYRVNLSNNLYRALERGEFQVYYQPQIDLRNDKIVGLEALLRWFHPEYGMLSPAEFISLAEQTGLINPIGNWVLETACAQTAEWTRRGYGDLRVAVNLSVVQLRNPCFVSQVENVLQKTGINPAQVELEITESTMTREPDYIVRVLNDLKALGVSLSIDDFGIEYSSLNRLKALPVDRLKMDMQFVRGIEKSAKDQAITMVIMNLAKNMDVKLIAEGVENSTQIDFLKNRMCDEVQGYFYYKPMCAADVEKVLKK